MNTGEAAVEIPYLVQKVRQIHVHGNNDGQRQNIDNSIKEVLL